MVIDKNSKLYKDYMESVNLLYNTIHEIEGLIEKAKNAKIPENKKQEILNKLELMVDELWSM